MLKLLLAAWIVYGPSGPIARTIVTSGDCPAITIDGTQTKMRVKSEKGADYPVTVCEADLAANVKSASIDGAALPVAKLHHSAKVAILGDTGCRMKAGSNGKPPQIQDCGDPSKWPFKQVADTIAKWDPDLIVHVGDYYYREAVCKGSTCTPSKYNWARWNADFFTPAAKLLSSAPWVMIRGNHETCSRAAEGWFRFLETRPYVWEGVQTCVSNHNFTPPYVVGVGDLSIAVIDSSGVDDELDETEATIFANELALVAKSKPGTWLTLHHPFWATSYGEEDSETLAAAWDKTPVPSLGVVISGHIHSLETLAFSDKETPQIVVGNGGTALDPAVQDPTGQALGGRTVLSFYQDNDFGFITATRLRDTWTFDVRDKSGKELSTFVPAPPTSPP